MSRLPNNHVTKMSPLISILLKTVASGTSVKHKKHGFPDLSVRATYNQSDSQSYKSVTWRFCGLTWVPQVTVLTEMDTGGDILETWFFDSYGVLLASYPGTS